MIREMLFVHSFLSSEFLCRGRFDASKAIRKVFTDNNITIAFNSEYDRFPTDKYIRDTLKEIKNEGRSELRTQRDATRRRNTNTVHMASSTEQQIETFLLEGREEIRLSMSSRQELI